jgi:hypothetical protein
VLPCLEEKRELISPEPPALQTAEQFSAFQVNLGDVNLHQQRKGQEISLQIHSLHILAHKSSHSKR